MFTFKRRFQILGLGAFTGLNFSVGTNSDVVTTATEYLYFARHRTRR